MRQMKTGKTEPAEARTSLPKPHCPEEKREIVTSAIGTKILQNTARFPTGLDSHGVKYVGGGSATDAELSSLPVPDWKGNDGRVGYSV